MRCAQKWGGILNSASKKILIVSSYSYFPVNEGNKKRLFDIVDFYMRMGWEVSFLLMAKNRAGGDLIAAHINGRFIFLKRSLLTKLSDLWQRACATLGWLLGVGWLRDYRVRFNCPPSAAQFVQNICEACSIEVVQIEYVFLSAALPCNPGMFRIIDTHDVMGDRWRHFKSNGLLTTWYSISKKAEADALAKAECVLAISQADLQLFTCDYGLRNVKLLSFMTPSQSTRNYLAHRVMFVGSNNRMNRDGLSWFVKNVLPQIMSVLPTFQLTLVGSVGNAFQNITGITVAGFVADLEVLYSNTLCVINPVSVGTGLPIKTLESLMFGVPVISRAAGARGFDSFIGKGILVADTPSDFANHILMAVNKTLDLEAHSIAATGIFTQSYETSRAVIAEIEREINEKHIN
jgi:glycosyltransferase involved in cell wall biosynthesis